MTNNNEPKNFRREQASCPHGYLRSCLMCTTHDPPEETKPTARAHLMGCVLDTGHSGMCYGPSVHAYAMLNHGAMDRAQETAAPALSPRQALGEALACVERARDLLRTAATSPEMVGFETRAKLFRAHEDANELWCSLTSARALLAQEKT